MIVERELATGVLVILVGAMVVVVMGEVDVKTGVFVVVENDAVFFWPVTPGAEIASTSLLD